MLNGRRQPESEPDKMSRSSLRNELIGALAALGIACIGLLHVLITDRVHFLYDYGDSLIGPILYNALHSGDPLLWRTSPTLFIPEMVQYLMVTSVVPDAHWAIAITGVMNVFGVYLATRLLVRVGAREATQRTQLVLSAAGLSLFVLIGFLEVGSTGFALWGHALEMFTISYTLPHYSASLIAALLTLGVAGLWIRPMSYWRRIWLGIGTAVMVGVATLSNPIFALWSVAPIAIAFLWMFVRTPRNKTLLVRMLTFAGTTLVAAAIGFRGRKYLAEFMASDGGSYIHRNYARETLQAYWHQFQAFISTPLGVIEAVVYAVLVIIITAVAIRSLWERRPERQLIGVSIGVVTVITTVGTVLVGQAAPRYSLPAWVAATVLLPMFIWWWVPSVQKWTVSDRAWRRGSIIVAAATVVTLLLTGVVVSQQRSTSAECLQNWIDEQDSAEPLIGAGGFWTSRRLAAYLPNEKILQVYEGVPLLWQNNAGQYLNVTHIDYVVVAPQDDAGAEIPDHTEAFRTRFGEPASVTQCDTFEIWDYRGTAGQTDLTDAIVEPFRN